MRDPNDDVQSQLLYLSFFYYVLQHHIEVTKGCIYPDSSIIQIRIELPVKGLPEF
jgi:hypothetical protein